jgi:methyl-accepting chemotaxis protein
MGPLLKQKTKNKADELILENLRKNDEGYLSTLDCETIFNEIAGKISLINETIQEISLATKEQSIGINQLDTAIIKLQEVADRNTLVASQSTEHAHEFEKQTANLAILSKEIDVVKNKNKKETPVFHKFEWNDKLVLGVKSMDDEHQVLIEKINAFISALEGQYLKKDKNLLMSTFVDLAKYTTHHFKDEEAYMESISYPQLNSHKKIHENLLNQVGQYGKQIEDGTINDKKVISFLRNWLLSHIMGVDMQYAHHHKPVVKKVKLAA